MKQSRATSIIIPTWDNRQFLEPCLVSLVATLRPGDQLIVVNNGHTKSCDWIGDDRITVVQTGGVNLGWEGGLRKGLEVATGRYVCFFNDDAYIPPSSGTWLDDLLDIIDTDPRVAAIGPSSNVVMGYQNIFAHPPMLRYQAKFLIGFCLLLRRSALLDAGSVDDTLPGGDDFDLSIRLRKKGYTLVADRSVFVFHHGFKTGERIHGNSDKAFGWNSYEFTEKVDHALITKHGFKEWWETKKGAWEVPEAYD